MVWRTTRILPLVIAVSLAVLAPATATDYDRHPGADYDYKSDFNYDYKGGRDHDYQGGRDQDYKGGRDHDYSGPQYHRPPKMVSTYVTQNHTTVEVHMGRAAHLPCAVKHLGTKQVSWYREHEEHVLTIGDLVWVRNSNVVVDYREFDNDVTHWNLTISRVKPEDEGVYVCEIIDKEKQILQVRLRVLDPPDYKPEIRIFGKEYIDLGEQIRLICNATGGDLIPEDIDWFKDGDIVDSMRFRNIIITKYRSIEDQALVSELIIDRSRGEDSGTYICRSSENLIDSVEVTVLVANSSNVKRGSGSASHTARTEHPFNKAALHISSSINLTTVMAVATLAFIHFSNS